MVGPKKQDFWSKINILKGNQFRKKLGMNLENKMGQTLKLENNGFYTNEKSPK